MSYFIILFYIFVISKQLSSLIVPMHTNVGNLTDTTALKKTNLTLLFLDASAANIKERILWEDI